MKVSYKVMFLTVAVLMYYIMQYIYSILFYL